MLFQKRRIVMGLIHIYCGDGKGKTTSALGLAVRAAGADMKVHIVQLLKGSETSELESLKMIPNISVDRLHRDFGFTFSMSESVRKEVIDCHTALLRAAHEQMKEHKFDMLIIDEFFSAYNYGLVDRSLADKIVFEKEKSCELILTGREPEEKFLAAADYISEINALKHPYTKGICARKGIEF